MRNYRHILMAALLAGAVSCSEKVGTDTLVPMKFTAGFDGIETKAFMNPEDLSDSDNRLTIWAFEGSDVLIAGKPASYTADGWALTDTYYWKSKDYTFFSYLSKDKDGNALTTTGTNADIDISNINPDPSGSSVTPGSTRSLKVNAKTFDFVTTDNNFDFCYSGVVLRPQTKADTSPVDMSLKHLYAAIGFSVHNYTSSSITLKEVTVVGLKNKKSAIIDFSDEAKVSYPTTDVACTWTNSSKTLYSNSTGTTITTGNGYANIVGTPSTTAQYYMFWPQTSDELAATGWTSNQTAPTGGAYLKVVYNQGGSDITRYAQFPQDNDGTKNLGWPAGTKRKMELSFRDNMFTLMFKAMPWDYIEPEITYGEKVTGDDITALSFDTSTCTVDATNHKVYFKGGSPITGTFKIAKPLNATWIISKEGDFDAFELDNADTSEYGDGKDCNYGTIDGNDCRFTLYPKVSNTGKTYSIQLTFSIRYSDGDTVCIDSDIQPVTWTFILID